MDSANTTVKTFLQGLIMGLESLILTNRLRIEAAVLSHRANQRKKRKTKITAMTLISISEEVEATHQNKRKLEVVKAKYQSIYSISLMCQIQTIITNLLRLKNLP